MATAGAHPNAGHAPDARCVFPEQTPRNVSGVLEPVFVGFSRRSSGSRRPRALDYRPPRRGNPPTPASSAFDRRAPRAFKTRACARGCARRASRRRRDRPFRARRRTVRVPGPRARPRGVSDHPLLGTVRRRGRAQAGDAAVPAAVREAHAARRADRAAPRNGHRTSRLAFLVPHALQARARAARPTSDVPDRCASLLSTRTVEAFLVDFFFASPADV